VAPSVTIKAPPSKLQTVVFLTGFTTPEEETFSFQESLGLVMSEYSWEKKGDGPHHGTSRLTIVPTDSDRYVRFSEGTDRARKKRFAEIKAF
jgi:hypothetical protein